MKKILLVSSSAPFLERNKHLLSRTNFRIYSASNGHEALTLHEIESVDLIVTELHLDDMGGDQFCSLLKRGDVAPDVPVILICHNISDELERARLSCADSIISKPIQPEQFLKTVGQYLNYQMIRKKRVMLDIKALTKKDVVAFACTSHNISLEGILLETDKNLSQGDRIVCIFSLPGSNEIRVEAEVARSVRIMTGGYQYGARFIDLSTEARRAIESYIINIIGNELA